MTFSNAEEDFAGQALVLGSDCFEKLVNRWLNFSVSLSVFKLLRPIISRLFGIQSTDCWDIFKVLCVALSSRLSPCIKTKAICV